MVVRYLGDNEWEGLEADALPTNAPVGARYTATDTKMLLIHVGGGTWEDIEHTPTPPVTAVGPERWYIYRDSTGATPYHALNKRTATVTYTGAYLDQVLNPVLLDVEAGDSGIATGFISHGGHIYLDGTDQYYNVSGTFSGFTIPAYTTIEGPPNARIMVPNGYSGYVFRIPSWRQIDPTTNSASTQGVNIWGMALHEAGTAGREWTGILLEAWGEDTGTNPYAGGIGGCSVIGTRITSPKRGIWLNQTSDRGWVNTCWFERIYISGPKWAGVDQDLIAGTPLVEFNFNMFRDITVQSSTKTPAYGFRNMGYKGTMYDNCQVWDVLDGQVKGNVDSRAVTGTVVAEGVTIRGGLLAHTPDEPTGTFPSDHPLVLAGYYSTGAAYPKFFQDGGRNTMVVGDWIVGSQMGKIYIPKNNSLGGTGILSIEGTPTVNANVEIKAGTDALASAFSLYNNTKSERFLASRSASSTTFEQVKQTAAGALRPILFRMNDVPGVGSIESFRINTNGDIQITDTRNIVLSATTGTKIGTATTQKLGFYNKAPIVQPAAITSPANNVDALKTAVDALRAALTNLGLTG